MQEHRFDAALARAVVIDLCEPCQAFWFDGRESLQLSPAATLALFRIIGERAARPMLREADVAKCPRCSGRLRRTQDLQRATRFEYFKCPNEHGRLISFFEFLKEKNFITPLTPRQITELRQHVQMINCSNCGASIDLARGTSCPHCRSALSMLDLTQAERVVEQLRRADRTGQPVDPALPLALARARAETDTAFAGLPDQGAWLADVSASGLVGAGLHALARLLNRGTPKPGV
jgi:DNA-directed RNA polymerase subunit RPC12/RpoP